MTSSKVSILTTVYNREKYLAACIESVLASSYQDWELIIVDDVSSDASVAIAQRYEKKDPRIKVYINEKNLGDYPNRNKAASYAKGKYLKYLDADDIIYPHGLEVMVHTMEQFPEAALGISQKVAEDIKPYPFVMQPQETFTREV
jgi:glycosyltransferase involved in cell wall biosynthesis